MSAVKEIIEREEPALLELVAAARERFGPISFWVDYVEGGEWKHAGPAHHEIPPYPRLAPRITPWRQGCDKVPATYHEGYEEVWRRTRDGEWPAGAGRAHLGGGTRLPSSKKVAS